MNITCFDDLLRAAREQAQPQRLLLVFTTADLPDGSSDEQRMQFEQGRGGALIPLMCVDKAPDALRDFTALAQEAQQFGHDWSVLFGAALSGVDGMEPNDQATEEALRRMVASIQSGTLAHMLPFDVHGDALLLH